jgi:hypothetical protein
MPPPLAPLTVSDVQKYVACILAMTIHPRSNIKGFWRPMDNTLRSGSNFTAKIGMSKNAFEAVRKKISYGPRHAIFKTFDGLRHLLQFYNDNLEEVFTAGDELVIDESTSGWQGTDEKRPLGPPCLVHMKGKPEPVSFMFKTMADVSTGIIVKIKLQEGKEEMMTREFSGVFKPSTAVVRRLLKGYEGTGRTIFGDSWFTNLNTVEMVRSIGNYYIGMVKTGHVGIPEKYMNMIAFAGQEAKRGDEKVVHLISDEGRIICVGWNEHGKKAEHKSKPPKILIGSTSSGPLRGTKE